MGEKSPPEEESVVKWVLPVAGRLVLITGLLVSALDHATHQQGNLVLTPIVILGIALFVVGLGLYFASRLYLGRFFSEKVRIRSDHRLITKGPYRYIRHPIYAGEILYFLSIPLIFSSIYGFVIMMVIIPMLLYRIGYEEKVLSSKFGQEYEAYIRRTRKLIPFIY
jgi:protein-S-isoprenylcysteine O-methyltransferase Ste14